MAKKVSSTFYLSAEDVASLKELAGRLGHIAKAGAATGQGSASELLRRLAENPLKVAQEIVEFYRTQEASKR
jgi:hypothetical protein